ncbi:hypothetical protein [Wenxinia marina]|uniref:Uncharacterized protein n=1 Tax=Wenxinia marina DSM 24838 TaxID=1123501 RepID=A0A0D0PG36_9RHOB|nr:hypothetical protein [Wenxinia marina]KIQ70296.1 hypothetical protein Wenmar_00671 [Wenxinia marina DSM 24838]GGL54217.1 hypothetical protein GCM10011392_05800 [Wenxinia marina]
MIRAALLCLALAPLPAGAAEFEFCWLGASGYTLTGRIAFPDALMVAPMVTEADVTAFEITGYLHGTPIGHWSAEGRAPDSTWHLRFVPATLTFPTGGNFPGDASQGWNADGDVDDCGAEGFGFNSGNYAQDVCLDGAWIADSSIDPTTPLVATTGTVTPECRMPELLSRADMRDPATL